jgi:murein DD-endopeptidase MepM/ murein hydrolase activator NlpD
MAEQFSFFILSGSGKFTQLAHCSQRTLHAIFGTLVLFMLVIAIGVADYIRMSRIAVDNTMLETELALQNQEVIHHRQQIQKFAREINQIKNRLVQVNQVDQLIRRVADMDESSGLFGIGGSVPEDLHYDLELERRHTSLIKKMHRQVQELENAVVYQQNSMLDLWKVVEQRGNLMSYTPTIPPAEGFISSQFGYRMSPFTGRREFHNGLDIANGPNTEIIATADGHICFVGETPGYGRMVLIDHGHGLTTRYAHLEQVFIHRGDKVKRGEAIAYMGSTGRSTGTHLHYEVRLNGLPVNPEKYFLN